MRRHEDPPGMPGSGESPADLYGRACPLAGTPGQRYVERRGVPLSVAVGAGVRYCPDWLGRPAVVAAMRDPSGRAAAVHGRYLEHPGRLDKMLTVGAAGGVVDVLDGWRADPVIVVEGLFDALTMAVIGRSATATIGRNAPWLPAAVASRPVWLAFDRGRSGDAAAAWFAATPRPEAAARLLPPRRCQDWNTALVRLGPGEVGRWVGGALDRVEVGLGRAALEPEEGR